MNRLLKWVLGIVAALAVLLLVLSIALPIFIDPNNYKEHISAAVKQDTGRDLVIAGEIQWKVFPTIGLQFNDLSLGNRAGFGQDPMLDIDTARLSVALWPLLSRQIEIQRINLDGVSAYLRSNTDGRNNWEDLSETFRAAGVNVPDDYNVPAELEVMVRNGAVELVNTGRELQIEGLPESFKNGPVHRFELQGTSMLEIPQRGLSGELDYSGRVQVNAAATLLAAEQLTLVLTTAPDAGDAGAATELRATTDAFVDLAGGQARLGGLSLSLHNLVVTGSLDVTSQGGELAYGGELKLAEFNPKRLIGNLGIDTPQTRNPDALTKFSASASFKGSARGMVVPDLVVVLDGSTMSGDVNLRSFEPPQLGFNLGVNTLNLDDYESPSSAVAEDLSAPGGAGLLAGGLFFFTGDGQLKITKLTLLGLTADNVSIGLKSRGNEIRLSPINARFYGGRHEGDIRIDLAAKPLPVLTADHVASGVNMKAFLREFAGIERVRGNGDVYFKVRSDLGGSDVALRSLSGDAGLSVRDGVIEGVDVAGAIERANALLGKPAAATARAREKDMPFSEIIATGVITRGILKSDDLVMRSPYMRATGKGKINLVEGTIDYLLQPVPLNDLAAQLPEQYRGVAIPVRVSGSLESPVVALDVMGGIAASQKAKIDEKAGELAGKLLEGVLGGKKDKKDKKKKKDINKDEADGGR